MDQLSGEKGDILKFWVRIVQTTLYFAELRFGFLYVNKFGSKYSSECASGILFWRKGMGRRKHLPCCFNNWGNIEAVTGLFLLFLLFCLFNLSSNKPEITDIGVWLGRKARFNLYKDTKHMLNLLANWCCPQGSFTNKVTPEQNKNELCGGKMCFPN